MKYVMSAVLLVAAVVARPAVADADAETLARLAAAKSVRLVVEQTFRFRPRDRYGFEPIQDHRLPFARVARTLLEGAGIRVVGAGATEFDATLTINATGRAIGRHYAIDGADFLFAGAEIKGVIVFETAGSAAWRTPFFGRQQPPLKLRLNLGYDRPDNAPFIDVFALPGSFVARIAQVIGAVYGAAPLIAVLDTGNAVLRASAVRALGDLGDGVAEATVIDALVATLDDTDPELRRQAAWSLGRLGDTRADGPLRERLRDTDADVRWFAAWALARITGASLDDMLAAASARVPY